MTSTRKTFTFIFTATLAAAFLIMTGLIGYQPPAHLSLDPATWRRGTWAGQIVLSQVALGAVLLAVTGFAAVRLNRPIPTRPPSSDPRRPRQGTNGSARQGETPVGGNGRPDADARFVPEVRTHRIH
jgi:hypothetical protein